MIEARNRYYQNRGTAEAMDAAADAYLVALRAYRKGTGKTFPIPTRAQLLRVL